jgi:2-haloacid dehalogenase
MPIQTYAFDVYGTLIDTNGVLEALRRITGDQAEQISAVWRSKQLEYSFRRGLMQKYSPFPLVTAAALNYALAVHKVRLTEGEHQILLDSYHTLPAFPDALAAIKALSNKSQKLFAFSNGPQAVVRKLLEQAQLLPYFDGVVSVEPTQVFKPSPIVYQYFAQSTQTAIANCALVSGNSFDVLGAKAAGMQGIWVRRDVQTIFDPWEDVPDRIIENLGALVA